MAKGRTLTNSERSAIAVISELQALGAIPSITWSYYEMGRISERYSVAEKEGIYTEKGTAGHSPAYCPGDPVLIRSRGPIIFQWGEVEVRIHIEQIVNMRIHGSELSEDCASWLPVKLEIKGPNRTTRTGSYSASISLENPVSISAFLRLGRAKGQGTFGWG